MIPERKISIELSVARVEGGGNTVHGKYFFAFERNNIIITERDTELTFTLSPDTPKDVVIETLVSSDARGQLGDSLLLSDGRSISVIVKNDAGYMMQIGLLLHDAKTRETIVCDPQVICRPRPPPP